MFTHIEVESTSARSTGRHRRARMRAAGATIALATLLAGCHPATTQLAARDPADPAAPVRGVGYRSTIAPYTSLRPATAGPWRERNEQVAPQPRSGREAQ
jgi:hypothetical protein